MTGVLLHASSSTTGMFDLAAVAEDEGLRVVTVDARRPNAVDLVARHAVPGAAYRSAGGLLARAVQRGARVTLFGAHAAWFVALPVELAGRTWALTDVAGARRTLQGGPAFVKLADAKFRALPARGYRTVDDLDAALTAVHAPGTLDLLVTSGWLPVHSEYRCFAARREVLTCSPYRVEDEPWTPLLRTHRASFHHEAAAFAADVLACLPPGGVPPTAVLDVARLDDGRFVVLEANHVWSAGLYGCDPRAVLHAVVAAAQPVADARWRWRPDPAAVALRV